MLLNYGNGGGGSGGGSGGETIINITGSTNSIVENIAQLNNISLPKNGDIGYVTTTKELYMYKDGEWTIVPTTDIFYNKLSTLNDIGHVQLTSDWNSESETLALTPKALKDAMDEIKELIDEECCGDPNEWDDVEDGIDDNGSIHEWGDW